jgi:hypothetical protein
MEQIHYIDTTPLVHWLIPMADSWQHDKLKDAIEVNYLTRKTNKYKKGKKRL